MLFWITEENGQRRYLPTGESFVLNGVQYLSGFLTSTKESELRKLGIKTGESPESLPSVDQICRSIDAERDRRMEEDYEYDFGDILAQDDFGNIVPAGKRSLQMKPLDRDNWTTLQGLALTAVISGQVNQIMPMRVEDNFNVLTTSVQVLTVLAKVTEDRSKILFYGGALKQHVRASDDPHSIDITVGWPE